MVKRTRQLKSTQRHRQRGWMMVELFVAMALFTTALIPLAYSIMSERRYARAAYQRAVAMEVVDGELEVLAAGEWRSFSNGAHPYTVHAGAVTNLPAGQFVLTVQPERVRLEWRPASRQHGGAVVREVRIR